MNSTGSTRRIVVIDENDKSKAIADGPSPDVRTDPARPGFYSARMWVSDSTPVKLKGLRETLNALHTLEPPPGGSVCRVVTFPPDDTFKGKVGAKEVQLRAGDTVVQRGTNHAWSNRSQRPCVVAFSSHDGE